MTLNSFMPVKLITGAGCVPASAKELAKQGKVCLIVTGKTSAKICGALQDVTEELYGYHLFRRFLHRKHHKGKQEAHDQHQEKAR